MKDKIRSIGVLTQFEKDNIKNMNEQQKEDLIIVYDEITKYFIQYIDLTYSEQSNKL